MFSAIVIGAALLAAPALEIQTAEWATWTGIGKDPTAGTMLFDFDDDGTEELVTISYSNTGTLRMSVTEPGRDDDLDPTVFVELAAPTSRVASVHVVPAHEAGIPLLRIDANLEACGPYSSTWVSYQQGSLRPALELVGLADPPQYASFDVKFDRHNQRAIVDWTNGDYDGTYTDKAEQLYGLEKGVYVVLTGQDRPTAR